MEFVQVLQLSSLNKFSSTMRLLTESYYSTSIRTLFTYYGIVDYIKDG